MQVETGICGLFCALMRLLQAQWVTLKSFWLESEVFVFTPCKDKFGFYGRDAFEGGTNGDAEVSQEIVIV